jgi:alpha-aminoadipic semialdehyde synthase
MALVLGIRREDKGRWERRVALTPAHVEVLVKRGIQVIVQPSTLRVFSDHEYEVVGASVQEDLSPCSLIIAVKEIPTSKLLPNKSYMFFSHTIKAQPANMAMLDDILLKKIRLIDYEKITNAQGQRLVRFGKFAGYAGMVDMFRVLGERLLYMGYSTPFLNLGYAHMYPRLAEARKAVSLLGAEIREVGLPRAISPMIFVFTGATGNVAEGALDIFHLLPFTELKANDLAEFCARSKAKLGTGSYNTLADAAKLSEEAEANRFKVFKVAVNVEDYTIPIDPAAKFVKADYYAHPEKYRSIFHEKIAPYASVIVNCAYWDQRYPRKLTTAHMRQLHRERRHRLIGIADISADIKGSIEFLHQCTSIDRPTFVYNIETGASHDGFDGKGVVILAVDNLPTELPREASIYFGDHLLPFLESTVRCTSGQAPLSAMPPEIQNAIVAAEGSLTPNFRYIMDLRAKYEATIRHVLLLGAGKIVAPAVDYLLRSSQIRLLIAHSDYERAKELVQEFAASLASAVQVDLTNPDAIEKLVAANDVVVNLEAACGPLVARACLKHRKSLITSAPITAEIKQLSDGVAAAGLLWLFEVGVDPGLDHMSILSTLEDVQREGGKVVSFKSVCGGLPAPECANNPLGYKFSLPPRGVILAGLNPAKYVLEGKEVEVPGERLLSSVTSVELAPCFALEMLPNRDAVAYCAKYGLTNLKTMFRGTLRFKGYAAVMGALLQLGLFDVAQQPFLQPMAPPISWPALLAKLLPNADPKLSIDQRVLAHLGLNSPAKRTQATHVRTSLEWLGFFDPNSFVPPGRCTLLDALSELLEQRLTFAREERDMVLMSHQYEISWPDCVEHRTCTLIAYGEPEGYSAMAKLYSLPTAIAAQMLLNGELAEKKGVIGPFTADIYKPVLEHLRHEGIAFSDTVVYE